jgi:hypothetical protein
MQSNTWAGIWLFFFVAIIVYCALQVASNGLRGSFYALIALCLGSFTLLIDPDAWGGLARLFKVIGKTFT